MQALRNSYRSSARFLSTAWRRISTSARVRAGTLLASARALAASLYSFARVRGRALLSHARACGTSLRAFARTHGAALLSVVGSFAAGATVWWSSGLAPPVPTSLRMLEIVSISLASIGACIASIQNTKATDDLQNKNQQIMDLQKQVIDKVIGGEGYCRLGLGIDIDTMKNRIDLHSSWTNTLYDVRIRYSTTEIALSHGEELANSLESHVRSGASFNCVGIPRWYRVVEIDHLFPREFRKLDNTPVNLIPGRSFIINARFSARNGQWHQSIIIKPEIGGNVEVADFLVRGKELLWKQVTDNFPGKERILSKRNMAGK